MAGPAPSLEVRQVGSWHVEGGGSVGGWLRWWMVGYFSGGMIGGVGYGGVG